jgi:hypothetical protein
VEDQSATRKLYEQNGRLWKILRRMRNAKQHRLQRAVERTRRAMEAAVGTPEAWDRAHGGLSWEERFPEQNAWFEREMTERGMIESREV